jgi:hypothetical protein
VMRTDHNEFVEVEGGLVSRMQKKTELRERAKRSGVEGRLGKFWLSQARGGSVRPL